MTQTGEALTETSQRHPPSHTRVSHEAQAPNAGPLGEQNDGPPKRSAAHHSRPRHAPPNDLSPTKSHEAPASQRAQAYTQARASHEPHPSTPLYADQVELGMNPSHAAQRPSDDFDDPDSYRNLAEVADLGPVQNAGEDAFSPCKSLEQTRQQDRNVVGDRDTCREEGRGKDEPAQGLGVSRWATQLYTISYLIFFSFLGTLARLGLQTLTNYPGAPVFPSVWFNFGGSLVMGFLAEDRMLFRNEWGPPIYDRQIRRAKIDDEVDDSGDKTVDLDAAKKAHQATKKTIPLYIGLVTGFCGSFTSFSSFVRDIFLALSNDLSQQGSKTTVPRNGGYSFMAVLAVIIITVSASLSGLFVGAHIAIASEPLTPSLPYKLNRKVVDRLGVFLGWGCWLGALLLTVLPPHDHWRGGATFALVFAPLGTLLRFHASLWLNGRNLSFPLGTFVVNVFGTAVLGMAWDLQRVPLGGVVGCQVLQGIEDGFCGCLTTVSTWVSELSSLRRKHAWTYGVASVLVSFGVMVVIMGGLRWTQGFAGLQCVH